MKKYLLIFSMIVFFSATACTAGYVATRPPDLRYARAVSPGPGYVWTSGEWIYSGGKYHWREGSWQRARTGREWKSGYWENNQKGYKWHKGYWK